VPARAERHTSDLVRSSMSGPGSKAQPAGVRAALSRLAEALLRPLLARTFLPVREDLARIASGVLRKQFSRGARTGRAPAARL
jgi:hypothetical protein